MKNYLATKWQSLRAWSTATWGRGRIGKAKVILAWYGIAVVVMAPVALFMPDVQLELRPEMKEPALLCRQQQSLDEIIDAKDATNQALMEKFRYQPEVRGRIITSDTYMQRDAMALRQTIMRKIAQGHCMEVTHGNLVHASWMDWPGSTDAKTSDKRMQVNNKGQTYWTYVSYWQKATGNAVAVQDRAPLQIAPIASEVQTQAVTPETDQAQPTPQSRPVPPFARGESYAQVRVVLMRDGWQPVISKDADQCMDGDTRCEGRPEMQTCSGSGMAMCRFQWHRDGQRLTICTAGEEQAMFHSICE